MSEAIQILDVVALTVDQPDRGVFRGQVGTVVEQLADNMFEVEFSDDHGRTYAMIPVQGSQLLVLRYEPVPAA